MAGTHANFSSDRELGMDRAIPRRDFLNGAAMAIGAGGIAIAHSLGDGTFWKNARTLRALPEKYDLIVVGGGIGGLAAAHFFRERAGGNAKTLILENQDDFGGHAKRNEFHRGGKLQLLNGGTMLMDSPTPYSAVAAGLMKRLGVDAAALDKKCTDHGFYASLGMSSGVFSTARLLQRTA